MLVIRLEAVCHLQVGPEIAKASNFTAAPKEGTMAPQTSVSLIVACPVCATLNRAPRNTLGTGGACGKCKNALFSAKPITIIAVNFDAHASLSDLPLLVDF